MKKNLINAGIQLVPLKCTTESLSVIDKAISQIEDSGMNYKVGALETVIEGEPDKIFGLINSIFHSSFENGAEEILLNIKIHARKNSDVTMESKTKKFEK